MSKYDIYSSINNFFKKYHKEYSLIDMSVMPVANEYKEEHPNAKYQVEVAVAYSIYDILLPYGISEEEINENSYSDSWLEKMEKKLFLAEKTLVDPTKFYLFIEEKEKYHNDKLWTEYYNKMLEKNKKQLKDKEHTK